MRFRRRRLGAALLLAPVLAVLGCSGDDDDVTAGSSTTTESTVDATTTTLAGGPVVEVLDAGSEPRVELRLAPEEGLEQEVTLHQQQVQRITVDGQSQETPAVPSTLDVVYRVLSVDDGRIETEVAFEGGTVPDAPDVDPQVIEAVRDVIDAFAGETASAVYSDRAAVLEFDPPEITFPGELAGIGEVLLASLADQASSLAVPFPEEPVGNGARWRASSTADIGGLPIEVVTEITLTNVAPPVVEGTMNQTLRFLPGPAEIQGTTVEVEAGELVGGGTIRWNLGEVAAYIDQTVEGSTALSAGATRLEQFQRQTIRITER